VLGSHFLKAQPKDWAFLLEEFPMWHVYICDRNGQLYTGITTDLDHRMRQHSANLLYTEDYKDKHEAAKRERQIKGWRREKKLALIKGSKVSLP
jgi:putative endonuclease